MSVPGCADLFQDEPAPPQCWPEQPVDVDPSGVAYQFVVDTIDLPATATEAYMFGLDLDCDGTGRPDNALGQILSTIAGQDPGGYDLDSESKQLIDAGQMLHLLQIQALSLDDADGVGVVVLHGRDADDDLSDNFSGQEPFDIDESRGVGFLSGQIAGGTLSAEYGTAPLAVAFPGLGEPFVLPLIGARLDIDIDDTGISGRIGGAVPEELIDSLMLPVFEEGLNRVVDRDCAEGSCAPDSFGEKLLELFDDCAPESQTCDRRVSVDELRDNSLVSSLLAPDVDLRDADGEFDPRSDGVKDALSVGIGFTAVGASFTAQ